MSFRTSSSTFEENEADHRVQRNRLGPDVCPITSILKLLMFKLSYWIHYCFSLSSNVSRLWLRAVRLRFNLSSLKRSYVRFIYYLKPEQEITSWKESGLNPGPLTPQVTTSSYFFMNVLTPSKLLFFCRICSSRDWMMNKNGSHYTIITAQRLVTGMTVD